MSNQWHYHYEEKDNEERSARSAGVGAAFDSGDDEGDEEDFYYYLVRFWKPAERLLPYDILHIWLRLPRLPTKYN